jgi:hypothetical protein
MKTWLAGSVIVASALASCGGDPLAPRATRELSAGYELLATTVEAGDRAEARSQLRRLMRSVDELQSAGAIDAGRAETILAAAEDVLADLRLLPAPSPSPSPSAAPSPSPSPTPASPPPSDDRGVEDDDDEDSEGGPGNSGGKGKGEAKGKGNAEAKGHDKD